MSKQNEISALTEEITSHIKIKFNEYAIAKYGCDELALRTFYNKYDQAIAFYEEKSDRNYSIGNIIKKMASLVFWSNLAVGLLEPSYYATMPFIYTFGVSFLSQSLGLSLKEFGTLIPGEEYCLNKKNPYIKKGTIEYQLAKDYSVLRKGLKINK